MASNPFQNRTEPLADNTQRREIVDSDAGYGAIADSYRFGWMGQMYDQVLVNHLNARTRVDGFDPLDHVPEGYEGFASAFETAYSPESVEMIRRNIDENIAIRRRREADGLLKTLGADLVTGITDPQMILAPELRGIGIIKGALKGSLILGTPNAAEEALRVRLDPTATREEGQISVAASFGVTGILGGGLGAWKRPAARQAAPTTQLNQSQIIRFVLNDLEGGSKIVNFSAADGGLTKFGIAAEHNPGVNVAGLTEAQASDIARRKYWLPEMNGKDSRLAAVAFDAYYISGRRDLVRRILGAPSPETAVSIYRAHLNNIADTVKGKAKFRRGWNNRVDKLARRIDASDAGVAMPDPVAARSFDEGIDIPGVVDFDGRGVPVRVGNTGRYDANGNYVFAAYRPRQERPIDPAGFSEFHVEPTPAAVSRETPLSEISQSVEDARPVRALDEATTTVEVAPAQEVAIARARIHALEEGDSLFFGQLNKEGAVIGRVMRDGLVSLSGKEKQSLAALLVDELGGDLPRLQAFFGGEPPKRLTVKAVRTRLDDVVKERIRLVRTGERYEPIVREPVLPSARSDYDPTRLQRRVEGMRSEADQLRRSGKAADARQADRLDSEADELEGELTSSEWAGGRGADGTDRYAGVSADRPIEMDEALTVLNAHNNLAERVRSLREQADNTTSEMKRARLTAEADELQARIDEFDDGFSVPFSGRSSAGEALGDEVDEHIVIDVDAVLVSFAEKPWTRPTVPGVTPLDDDAFANPRDWLNFVFLHEREHTVNPRREGEALADYENRINARALDELASGKRPLSPEMSALQRAVIYPTPLGRIMRLAPEGSRILEEVQHIGGDMGTQTAGRLLGTPVAVGGSVYQRSLRWLVANHELRSAIRREWLSYVKGEGSASAKMNEIDALRTRVLRTAQRSGKLTLPEFKAMVTRAQVDSTADVPIEARRAANVLNGIFQRFERGMKEAGIADASKRIEAERLGVRSKLEKWRATAEEPHVQGVREDINLYIRDLEGRLAELDELAARPMLPAREGQYFHRIWDLGAVKKDRERVLEALKQGYLREMREAGEAEDVVLAELRAKGAFDTITQEPDGTIGRGGRAGATKERTVPLTNAEAFDWIVKDPELIMAVYSRRLAPQIEMAKRYGDPFATGLAEELRLDMLIRGASERKARDAMQVFLDTRDRVLGQFHGKDPMSWDNRTARLIKNMTSLSVMGRTIFSQIVDVGRTIGVVGPAPLWKSLVGMMAGDLARLKVGPYAKEAGEALDLVMARANARMIEADDAFLVNDTAFERGIANMQAPFYVANLMIPFTVMMKEWASLAAGHIILDEAARVASAVQKGLDPDPKLAKRLFDLGIDLHDAQLLARMPHEQTGGGLRLANVMAWEGEQGQRARDLFLGAVSGDVRRAVITPGPLDKPAIFDGVLHMDRKLQKGMKVRDEARDARDAALEELRALRRISAPDDVVDAAAARYIDAAGAFTVADRNLGRAGRFEAPLLSLPFQLKTFTMTAAPKLLHGLLGNRDRAKAAGLLSVMAAGVLSTYLKMGEGWDYLDFRKPEDWMTVAYRSFDNSGMASWFGDVGKAVEATADMASSALGEELPAFIQDRDDLVADDVGNVTGVSTGLIAGLIEAMVTDGMDNDQRASAIRRAIPLNNLIWWDQTVKKLGEAMTPDDDSLPISREMEIDADSPLDVWQGFEGRELPEQLVGPLDTGYGFDAPPDIRPMIEAYYDRHPEKLGRRRRRRPDTVH